MKAAMLLLWAIFSPIFTSLIGNENKENFGTSIGKQLMVLRMSRAWLIDLEQSYQISFQNQFKTIQYRNSSVVPNPNIAQAEESWCQNVTVLNMDQNERLIHYYGYDSVLNSTVNAILDNPRAKLYEFEDHWGDTEYYRFSRNKYWCTDITNLNRKVKSVYPFGKCIRLFQLQNCMGWSLAVYPGSSNFYRLLAPPHVRFQSIGPCLGNEFSAGYLNKAFPGFVVKNTELRGYIPDLIRIHNPDINFGITKKFNNVKVKYVLGSGNRTEVMNAHVGHTHFRFTQNVSEKAMNLYIPLEKENGDVLGHAIPTIIGGPPNEAFNIFAADPTALKEWNDFVSHYFAKEREFSGTYILQFEYENENKTRPLSIYFWVRSYTSHTIRYGRIINGRGFLKRDSPYTQIIPKYEFIDNIPINLSRVFEYHGETTKIAGSTLRNTFIRNFNIGTEYAYPSMEKCKRVHFTNEQELKENVTEALALNDVIQEILRNPMLRLFGGENHTGYFQDYHSSRPNDWNGCYNTRTLENPKSAETLGKCVRLFVDGYCTGLSLAIYGGNVNSNQKIGKILGTFFSAGPCLQDEFINTSFRDQVKGYVEKNPNSSFYIPDLFQFTRVKTNKEFRTFRMYVPFRYLLGPRNRIEHITAYVSSVVILKYWDMRFNWRKADYKPKGSKNRDVSCYVIPVSIGGPENELFNTFSTSKSKCRDWFQIFPSSFYIANEFLQFEMEFHFVYENDNSSRPQFIFYHFAFELGTKIYYGRFYN